MKWTALLILGIAGCSVPPQRRLSERGSEFQFMISAENRSVSTWTLRLDPPRLAGREEGVLTPKGPAGTELERIFARKFPAAWRSATTATKSSSNPCPRPSMTTST
jgi:hypothetical protein